MRVARLPLRVAAVRVSRHDGYGQSSIRSHDSGRVVRVLHSPSEHRQVPSQLLDGVVPAFGARGGHRAELVGLALCQVTGSQSGEDRVEVDLEFTESLPCIGALPDASVTVVRGPQLCFSHFRTSRVLFDHALMNLSK